MKHETIVGKSPFEVGDFVNVHNDDGSVQIAQITDIEMVCHVKDQSASFRYELDGSGEYHILKFLKKDG